MFSTWKRSSTEAGKDDSNIPPEILTCCDCRPQPSHEKALFLHSFGVAENDDSQYEQWVKNYAGVWKRNDDEAEGQNSKGGQGKVERHLLY